MKLNRYEDEVFIKNVDGKAIFYAKNQNYYRLMAVTEIEINETVCLGAKDFKALANRMNLIKPERFIINENKISIDSSSYFNYTSARLPNLDLETTDKTIILDTVFLNKIKNSKGCVCTDKLIFKYRPYLWFYHFEDGKCIATDNRILSCVKGESNFVQKLLEMSDGNIYAKVFDYFNGKNPVRITKCVDDWLQLTDGTAEIYIPANSGVQFPALQRVIPAVTDEYRTADIINLNRFKKLLPLLKSYSYKVLIDNSVCSTPDNTKLCEVGDVLNGYAICANYLATVAELFGNSAPCTYNAKNNERVIIFGDLSADFILAVPQEK